MTIKFTCDTCTLEAVGDDACAAAGALHQQSGCPGKTHLTLTSAASSTFRLMPTDAPPLAQPHAAPPMRRADNAIRELVEGKMAPAMYRAWIVAGGFNPDAFPFSDLEAPEHARWIAVAYTAHAAMLGTGGRS